MLASRAPMPGPPRRQPLDEEHLLEQRDVRLDVVVVHVEARADLAVAQEVRRLRGEQAQQPLDVVDAPDVGELERDRERASPRRSSRTSAPGGGRAGECALPGSRLRRRPRERGAPGRRTGHLGRAPGEQLVHDVQRPAPDLALGERPHVDAIDPSRERILDPLGGEHVGGTGDHETAGRGVGVDGLLELEQQVGRAVDLVDERRARQVSHESGRVATAASRVAWSSSVNAVIGCSCAAMSLTSVVLPTCRAPPTKTIRESSMPSTMSGRMERGNSACELRLADEDGGFILRNWSLGSA